MRELFSVVETNVSLPNTSIEDHYVVMVCKSWAEFKENIRRTISRGLFYTANALKVFQSVCLGHRLSFPGYNTLIAKAVSE